ncbi:MAG TPA: hypothetical protein VMD31_14925 [Opitutaceae bacterium]|nr:hypothetical protein [Opitutaceae bacterium]
MNTRLHLPLGIFACLLGTGAGFSAETTAGGAKGSSARLDSCTITVLEVYCWRDWMPIVAQPGPDRGSPLRVKVRLQLDNSTGAATHLAFRGRVLDEAGKGYPITFGAQPNYRILPVAVAATYRDLTPGAREAVDAKYGVVWSGPLQPGESREVELLAGDGPYLPVGSAVRVELTWTDAKGASVSLTTEPAPINRTD